MAVLRIQGEGDEDRIVTLDQDETVLGRAADNTVIIDDPAASSRHCVILRKENRFTLRDLNSTNGTYLNGAQVTEASLAPGDVLTVGSVRMTLEGEDIQSEPAVVPTGTRPQDTIRTGPLRHTPPEFGVRKNRAGLWVFISIIILLALAGLIYQFVSRIMR